MTPEILQKFEPVIGLEVHAQMLTKSKAFCGCTTEFGAQPNHNTCPICLGHPGTLPVLNENLLRFIVRMGLATNCRIRERSIFARKNYFYPDLPKGYQISQYETPICHDGFLEVELKDGAMKRIGITRIHMEEDAGKSIHDFGAETLVDLNRAGVPLIEIVSEPDMRSAEEAIAYLKAIRSTLIYLGISNGNMEEGSLRCDVNVSARLRGTSDMNHRTEIKNRNSFKEIEKSINIAFNQRAQAMEDWRNEADLDESSREVVRRLLNTSLTGSFESTTVTVTERRSKEKENDYRYFPEPDLLPVTVTEEYKAEVKLEIPELQRERRDRFVTDYKLPKYDADILTAEKPVADFFETAAKSLTSKTDEGIKSISNYIMGDVMRLMSERKEDILQIKLKPQHLSELVDLIQDKTISNKIAKDIFPDLLGSNDSPKTIVEKRGLVQVTDTNSLRQTVLDIIAKNQTQLGQYKSGKTNLFGFFVGQVMKATQGKANPEMVNELMKEELEKA